MHVPFEKLKNELKRILLSLQFTADKADLLAQTFAESSRDGVYTHGLNRFPSFVQYVTEGLVNPGAGPVREGATGALEQWNGNLGPGILNAIFCMDRAMQLAAENGIGCVAIKNTNDYPLFGFTNIFSIFGETNVL